MTTHATPLSTLAPRPAEAIGPSSRTTTLGLGVTAALFVIYPALRPYSVETGYAGAQAFASWSWGAAHLAAIAAFVLLTRLVGRLDIGHDRAARTGRLAVGLGATLVLPYYGAEAFGVGAVGRWAIDTRSPGQVTPLLDAVRYGAPALVLFAAGLLLLAVGGVALGVALWRHGARTAAVLLSTGLVLYLPQFTFPPTLRVAHGVVLALGLVLCARHASTRRPVG